MLNTTAHLISNRYALHEQLGAGAMGTVYRATDRLTGEPVAIKRVQVAPKSLQFASRILESKSLDIRLALAQEFRTLAALRHPYIISVLDYGFDHARQPYFAMELLENPQTILEFGIGKPVETQICLLIELLQALIYLHRRAIIHRDLKPANILVTQNEKVRVLDFGLSTSLAQTKGMSGTLAYMAPEVLRHQPTSSASDLFAVGVIAYQLLTGQYPFQAQNPARLMANILNHEPNYAAIPNPALAAVIRTCLEKDPQRRYANGETVIAALSAAINYPLPPESSAIRESFLQTAPFIGRDAELAQLVTALDKAIQREGSLWLIGGESGVGKSRLMDELRPQALVKGAMVLRGQGVEGGGLAYQIWRDILPRLLLSTPLNDLEAGILRDVVPHISTLLGRDIPNAPELTGQAGQQRLASTLCDMFQRQTQPVVLLLEDLQWTEESLIPLKDLNQIVDKLPLLIVGTYRNEERPDLPDEFTVRHLLKLRRLNMDMIAKLSYAMLGEVGKKPEILKLLQRETEGNAFFLVEIVRTLAEDAGRLANVGSMALPNTVFAGGITRLNRRRLNRVPSWGQSLLKLAAVIGRQIDIPLLRRLAPGIVVDNWLAVCADAAVLEVVEDRWRFTHDKLRETVVADLSDTERPHLHRKVAQAIEALYPQDNHYASVLADHWHHAGDREKEALYAFKAAESLHQLGLSQAQEQALRAFNLRPADPLLWAKINILVAENYFTWGDYAKAREHYEITLAHAREHQFITEELVALDGLGQVTYITRDLIQALDIYQDAIDLAQKTDNKLLQARLLEDLGTVLRFIGNHEAAYQALKTSLAITYTLNDPSQLAMSLYGISIVVRNRGEYAEACEYLKESIAILLGINAVRDVGMSLNNLGICHTLMGDYPNALQYLEEGLAYRQKVGHLRGAAASKSAIGEHYWVLRHYAKAQQMYQEALDFWQSIGDLWNIANSHADVAFPLFAQGEVDSATHHWYDALQKSQELQAGFVILKALIGFAWLAHHQGDDLFAWQLLHIAQTHQASTQPLRQMWIQPLVQQMETQSPANMEAVDLSQIMDAILNNYRKI